MANKESARLLITSYFQGRRAGVTTRLADAYIQELFTDRKIIVEDHHGTRDASLRLFKIILERLSREHFYGYDDMFIEIDKKKLTISIKEYNYEQEKESNGIT